MPAQAAPDTRSIVIANSRLEEFPAELSDKCCTLTVQIDREHIDRMTRWEAVWALDGVVSKLGDRSKPGDFVRRGDVLAEYVLQTDEWFAWHERPQLTSPFNARIVAVEHDEKTDGYRFELAPTDLVELADHWNGYRFLESPSVQMQWFIEGLQSRSGGIIDHEGQRYWMARAERRGFGNELIGCMGAFFYRVWRFARIFARQPGDVVKALQGPSRSKL